MLQLFQRHVASVFYLDVAYISHMLQEYITMVSAVLVLCCSKFFHVQVLYLDVTYASHKYFKCMFQMFHLLQTYVAFKCFMLQVFRVLDVCLESHWGIARPPGEGTQRARGCRWGARHA